jgi:hypothetical protein
MIIKNKVAYLCIAHTKPLFELPYFYNLLQTANFVYGEFNGYTSSIKKFIDNDSIYKPINNYYPDYSFSFIEYLLNNNNDKIDYIFLTLHRKFLTRDDYGTPSQNFYGMNIVNNIPANSSLLEFDFKSDFLISKPLIFSDGVVGQFSRKHNIEDFHTFFKLLKTSNILTNSELDIFLAQKILFPAVPLGLLPYKLFLNLIKSLSIFTRHTDSIGYEILMPNDVYQSRARSFFMERLASFLFIKYLNNPLNSFLENDLNFGNCITINIDNQSNIYKGGTV